MVMVVFFMMVVFIAFIIVDVDINGVVDVVFVDVVPGGVFVGESLDNSGNTKNEISIEQSNKTKTHTQINQRIKIQTIKITNMLKTQTNKQTPTTNTVKQIHIKKQQTNKNHHSEVGTRNHDVCIQGSGAIITVPSRVSLLFVIFRYSRSIAVEATPLSIMLDENL